MNVTTMEGINASVIIVDSVNHAITDLGLAEDNVEREQVTDVLGGNLVSVPITFMDKDKGESVDPATETLAAMKGAKKPRGSTRDNNNVKTREARSWKRKERPVNLKKKIMGKLNEVGRVTVGKKTKGSGWGKRRQ